MVYKLQFREKGMKRFFNFSTRKLKTKVEARKLMEKAKKDFPNREFKIK